MNKCEIAVENLNKILTINSDWRIKFPENHFPLAIWRANASEYNLLECQDNPLGPDTLQVYQCRFLYSGKISSLKIVLDRSAIRGDWKLFFNDVETTDFKDERIYDCYNFSADLTKHIRTGSTPTENKITIIAEGKGQGLFEMPYLYGDFTCEYRHAYRSLPFLRGCDLSVELDLLLPWQTIGYPAFSGAAEYSAEFEAAEPGEYQLDLGRVEDLADVFIDD